MQEGVNVIGFEIPASPDASYNNLVPGNEEPPLVPPHLQHTLLSFPPSHDDSCSLPPPQNVVLILFYIERENTRSVVALGITHRLRVKFVTVVLYCVSRSCLKFAGTVIKHQWVDTQQKLIDPSCCRRADSAESQKQNLLLL
jgi:hypothetical protein